MTQIQPSEAGATNATCHPNFSVKKAISGGAIRDPTIVPPLKTPTANAFSLAGNHSETTLTPPEKLPHSPVPIQNRKIENWNADRAIACRPAAKDHQATANERPRLTPKRSMTQPIGNSPTIIPNMNADTMRP